MNFKDRVTPVCNECGTSMINAIDKSMLNYWCPQCRLGTIKPEENIFSEECCTLETFSFSTLGKRSLS